MLVPPVSKIVVILPILVNHLPITHAALLCTAVPLYSKVQYALYYNLYSTEVVVHITERRRVEIYLIELAQQPLKEFEFNIIVAK